MNFKIFLLSLILIHLFLLSQIKFTVWPEMVLYPYLMMHNFAFYKDIIAPYFPLLPSVTFLFFKIFGLSILNLKLLTWSIIIISDLVVFYTSKKLSKKSIKTFLSLLTFIILQIYFGGNSLWFELFLTPFIILALILVYYHSGNLKKTVLAGLLFALAVLIKQNSVLFLIPISIYFISQKKYRLLLIFLITSSIIFLLTGAAIFKLGVWNDFFEWAILLPLTFGKQNGFVQLPAIRQYLIILFPLITLIPFLLKKENKISDKIFWILSFLIALQFALPRYENFHLQLLVALSAIFVSQLPRKYLTLFMLLVVILFGLSFVKDFHQSDRFVDSSTLRLADKIKNYPSVYLLNASELSYFFAARLPPKPWATNFPWYFESNNFQILFINDFKKQKIQYVVIGDPIGGGKYTLGNYLPSGLINDIHYNYVETGRFENYSIWQIK